MASRLFELVLGQRGMYWDIPWPELDSDDPVTRDENSGRGCLFVAVAALLAVPVYFGLMSAFDNGALSRVALRDYTREDAQALEIILLFALLSALALLSAFLWSRLRWRLTISKSNVQITTIHNGRVKDRWTEPLTCYNGVALKTLTVRTLDRMGNAWTADKPPWRLFKQAQAVFFRIERSDLGEVPLDSIEGVWVYKRGRRTWRLKVTRASQNVEIMPESREAAEWLRGAILFMAGQRYRETEDAESHGEE